MSDADRFNQYEQPPFEVPRFRAPEAGAREVVVREPVNGEWTGSPQWGQNVELDQVFVGGTPDFTVPREVLSLQDFGRPEMLTLQLNLRNNTLGSRYAIVGVLDYGAGAGIQTIEFDWLNGQQLSVVANNIKLKCYLQTFSVAGPIILPLRLSVSVLVGIGTRASDKPPPQRSYNQLIAPADFFRFKIPNLARRVLVYDVSDAWTATTIVAFETGANDTVSRFTLDDIKPGTYSGQGIVIPAWAEQLSILNNAVAPTAFVVVFQLDM